MFSAAVWLTVVFPSQALERSRIVDLASPTMLVAQGRSSSCSRSALRAWCHGGAGLRIVML